MAVNHNFRSALSGFNRGDVVRYIEYMNTKHNEQISELNAEAEQLREQLQQHVDAPEKQARIDELEAKCAELAALLEQAQSANADLEAKCDQLKAEVANCTKEQEIEAYRRAENIERQAKDRAEHLFQQAAGTLAQATTQVDSAATSFIGVADRITSQIDELRSAVEHSKNALRDAATTMYSIRPTYSDK